VALHKIGLAHHDIHTGNIIIALKAKETALVDLGLTTLPGHPFRPEYQLDDRLKLSRTCQTFLEFIDTYGDDHAKVTYTAVSKMFADKAAIQARSTASILRELRYHIAVYEGKLSIWTQLWSYPDWMNTRLQTMCFNAWNALWISGTPSDLGHTF